MNIRRMVSICLSVPFICGCADSDPPPPKFSVSVLVSGLVGSGLVLQDNGGDDLAVPASGSFTFATPLRSGAAYAVSVLTQPTLPFQVCGVLNGNGLVGSTDVTDVVVECSPPSEFKVTSTVPADGDVRVSYRAPFSITFSTIEAATLAKVSLSRLSDGSYSNVPEYDFTAVRHDAEWSLYPPFLGWDLSSQYKVTAQHSLDSRQQYAFGFTIQPGTIITHVITSDTTLTLAGSPYIFNRPAELRDSVLTIEPGVEITGGLGLSDTSRIEADGTEYAPIVFWNGTIGNWNNVPIDTRCWGDAAPFPCTFNTSHFTFCDLQNFGLAGHFRVTHSKIVHYSQWPTDMPVINPGNDFHPYPDGTEPGGITDSQMSVWNGWGTGHFDLFERNVVTVRGRLFSDSFAEISEASPWTSFGSLRHNLFLLDSAIMLFHVAGPHPPITGNSFIGLRDGAAAVWAFGGPGVLDMTGNFWGTTDLAKIRQWIRDSYSDSNLTMSVAVEPFLTEPAPETPSAP